MFLVVSLAKPLKRLCIYGLGASVSSYIRVYDLSWHLTVLSARHIAAWLSCSLLVCSLCLALSWCCWHSLLAWSCLDIVVCCSGLSSLLDVAVQRIPALSLSSRCCRLALSLCSHSINFSYFSTYLAGSSSARMWLGHVCSESLFHCVLHCRWLVDFSCLC